MNENFATTTIDEHIAVETERREAFRNFLLEERIDPRLSPEAEEYSLYPGEDRSGEHEEPEEPSEEIADSDDD